MPYHQIYTYLLISTFGDNMKVGDLVRARHWQNGEIAILLSFRGVTGICSVVIGDYVFDQLVSDLELVCNSSRI